MEKGMTFNNIIRIIHDDVPSYISFLILLKYHFTNNWFFHVLSYFFRLNGLIILCADFSLKLDQIRNKSFPYYLRYLTSYKLIEISGLTNAGYIIISYIIFFLFCLRLICYMIIMEKIKRRQNTEEINLTLYKIVLFFEHIVFLLYPFILEFLVQIIFSFIFKDNFLFEKDMSKILNIIVAILNAVMIIGYNINNYFFMIIINRPYDDKYASIKFRYSDRKFWIIFLMQNISLIQNIQLYFTSDKQVEIFSYIYLCFFCVLFLLLFLISLQKYNYNNIVNSFLSIMASFCFFSIIIKCFCSLFNYSFKTTLSIVSMNIFKLIVSIYFNYLIIFIGNNFLFKSAVNELFKINKENTKHRVYDCFWYILEILKKVKNNEKDTSTVMLLNSIFQHQNKCSSSNCKCKLIQIIPHGKQYDESFTQNLLDRISFLIESSFIQLDFSENCELALILSEHFFFFRDNSIMAFSFIQTLLTYNMDNFCIQNFLDCYEVCQKYIEEMTNLKHRVKTMRKKQKSKNEDKIAHENLLETNFKETFLIYEKIQKIQEIMNDYCQVIIDVIKKRNIVEESVKFKKFEDTGEIITIDFTYLNETQMEEIIKILYYETNLNKDLIKEMGGLKTSKFPMEFYYKIFLFWDSFMEGKIDEKFIPIFYSFTRDHNLYSTNINPNIFFLLRQRYIDLNKNENNLYYCIFKYSKGMTISYFSEPFAQILGYLQSELIDSDIDILMPNDLSKAHNNLLMHYLITKQNRVYEGIKNKFFNKKGLLYNGSMNGAALLGLGKHLLVMINSSIIENENEYDLYYNQSLELISFSNNFGKDFFMDLDLIAKCNMNLLALFGINQELIKKKLSEIKLNIIDYKYFLEIMTEEIFSKKLYKSANKYNVVKYKLFDEIESQNFEESENYHINNKLLKTQRCLEYIYNNKFKDKMHSLKLKFKRQKSLVLNNFDKFVNNNDKIDFNDKYYKSLLESFHLLQSNNIQNKTIGNMCNVYSIDVDMHILYDVPLITIKIKEQYDMSISKPEEIEKPLGQNKSNIHLNLTKQSTNSKNVSFDVPNKQDSLSQLTRLTNDGSVSSIGLPANLRIINFEEKSKLDKSFFERYIKQIVLFCIFCVLVVYVAILVYQLNVIDNIFNIFLAFYYNYIQRDKLVNLETALISGYYYYTGLEDYSEYISLEGYKEFTKNMAEEYSDSYHIFYQNYIKYRFAFGRDLSPFYINYNFSKIHVSWNETTSLNNYIEEAEVLIYQCILSTLEDTREGIIEDAHLFFNSSFRNNEALKKLNTIYAQILYYLCKNMQDNFVTFFASIQNEIDETQQNYSKYSRILSTAIEVLGFILNFITLGSCIYFLKKSNNSLYKSIINLFIDYTQEGNYSFKNSYDNFMVAEKLSRLKFVLNNFSIKAIDKYNKKITYGTLNNKNDLDENDNNNNSFQSKPNGSSKKQPESSKKKKLKISKGTTSVNKNDSNLNKTNNNSLTMSKSQNKFLNTLSVNLVSKLNQNMTPDKSNINISTKNGLGIDASTQNLNTKIKNNEIDEENSLTIDKIFEKLKIFEITSIKFFTYSCICLVLILFVYSFIKLLETFQYFDKSNSLFVDYSIVTFEYSMIMNYFNNLNILFINQPMGRIDYMTDMQNKVEAQFKKSEEVKKKSLKNYPKINEIFEILNDQDDSDKIRELLCKEDTYCINIYNSKYNVVRKGIDVGLKSIAQVIYNDFRDFLQLREKLDSLENVKHYFMTEDFTQVDLSLNFLLYEVEERCADAFLEEAENLINSFETVIISLNVFIIIFLTIISLSLIFLIINRITILLNLIKKSTLRISISINFMKEKCGGGRTKSGNIL